MVNSYRITLPCLLAMTLLALSTPIHAAVLSGHEWTHRPLLIFAENTDDPQYQSTLKLLKSVGCELNERDMIIGEILTLSASRLHDAGLDSSQANEIRQQFAIKDSQFVVILIGKDGEEKYRTVSVPVMQHIFSLIDGMPMRQQEMQLRAAIC